MRYGIARPVVGFRRKCVKERWSEKIETLSVSFSESVSLLYETSPIGLMAWRDSFLFMTRVFVAHVSRDRSLIRYRLHLRDRLLPTERFLVRGVTPVHGRKYEKGASLHRNRISMPGMATRGPVFRGVELRHETDAASHQAKCIPCRRSLAFS